MPKETTITREEAMAEAPCFKEMLEKESHHHHEIIRKGKRLFWKENPKTKAIVDRIGLNEAVTKLCMEGFTKNHEEWRRLFRDIGVSLGLYEETFHWDGNNEETEDYKKNGLLEKTFYLDGVRI